MADQPNNQAAQLPVVQDGVPQASPMATSSTVSTNGAPQTGVVQQSVAILMNTNLSPYQMAGQFASVKENYLATTYGITIE